MSLFAEVREALARAGWWGEADDSAPIELVPVDLERDSLVATTGIAATEVDGDFRIRAPLSIPGGLVVRGALTLEAGAQLDAPLQVFGDVTLGARASLTRPLIVHGSMTLGEDAVVPTCRVEGDVHLAQGARVDGDLQCGGLYLAEGEREAESFADLVTLNYK